MAENKDFDFEQNARNLKKADSKKSLGDSSQLAGLRGELFGARKVSDKGIGTNVKVKKRIPIAVDIIAGILMLALTCAVIVGSYMLFRYYSDDYDSVNVVYTAIVELPDNIESYGTMKGSELFMDVSSNSVYFGKITEVRVVSGDGEVGGQVLLTVSANAKYRDGKGYSIGDSRLAVGSKHTLRSLEKSFAVTVIDLTVNK